jgi:hypothetical protein
VKPSRPGQRSGLGIFLTGLEVHGGRGGVGGGVERRGAASARCAGEAHRGGGGDEVGNRWIFLEGTATHKREGRGELGLNPNDTPLIPRA